MGTLRFNIISNPNAEPETFEYTLLPGYTYSFKEIDIDFNNVKADIILEEQPGNGTITASLTNFTTDQTYWPKAVEEGLKILQKALYPGLDGSNPDEVNTAFFGPQVDKLIERASKGENTIVDFSLVLPVLSKAGERGIADCKDKNEQVFVRISQSIDEAMNEAQDNGYNTFRLPEGGGIVKASDFTSQDAEKYAKRQEKNCEREFISFNTVSIFEAAAHNT